MNAIYKLKNGQRIEINLREDIINGNPFPNTVSGYMLYENGEKGISPDFESILLRDKTTGALYFLFNDEKIYISDFQAMNVQELIDKIEQDEEITRDDIVATLIKHGDNIAFVTSIVYHTCVGVEQEVRCIPEIKGEGKIDWEIGITLIPENLSNITLYRPVFMIYQELIDKIRSGEISVICRDTRKKRKNPQKVMKHAANK